MKLALKLFKKDVPPKVEFRTAFTLSVYFVRPKKWYDLYAWAIRLFIWAPYCHTAIGFNDFIFESVARGAIWTPLKRFRAKNKVIAKFDITLTRDQYVKLRDLCRSVEKTPYDWRAIINLALYKLGRKPLFPDNGRKYLFCSELACVLLQDLGLLPKNVDAEFMDPKRFLRLLEAAKNPLIVRKF